MKIIKNINNNFAVAVDKKGNTVIIRGKGIGFGTVPREVDKKLIERSYYEVDENYVTLIKGMSDEIITVSTRIIDKARTVIENPINSTIVFTLADHINFAIERHKKNMDIKLPLIYDIQHLYEKEYDVGLYGLKEIKRKLNVYLPKEEACYIALHIINAEKKEKKIRTLEDDEVVEEITKIIEKEFNITIRRENFNFSRFVSHIYYLLKRSKSMDLIKSDNGEIYEKLKIDYQKTYECAEKVSRYFEEALKVELTDEEKLYLILHINRLCTYEDCDQ